MHRLFNLRFLKQQAELFQFVKTVFSFLGNVETCLLVFFVFVKQTSGRTHLNSLFSETFWFKGGSGGNFLFLKLEMTHPKLPVFPAPSSFGLTPCLRSRAHMYLSPLAAKEKERVIRVYIHVFEFSRFLIFNIFSDTTVLRNEFLRNRRARNLSEIFRLRRCGFLDE